MLRQQNRNRMEKTEIMSKRETKCKAYVINK